MNNIPILTQMKIKDFIQLAYGGIFNEETERYKAIADEFLGLKGSITWPKGKYTAQEIFNAFPKAWEKKINKELGFVTVINHGIKNRRIRLDIYHVFILDDEFKTY